MSREEGSGCLMYTGRTRIFFNQGCVCTVIAAPQKSCLLPSHTFFQQVGSHCSSEDSMEKIRDCQRGKGTVQGKEEILVPVARKLYIAI